MSPFPTPCKGKSKSQPFAHTFALTGRRRLYTDTQGVALGYELVALSGRSFSRFVRLSCAHALPLIIWLKSAFLLNNKVRRSPGAKHCSSLCSQSEGDEYCGGQARAENPTKSCPRALVMFATCSWPSLCEQSELQCWRCNRRLCGPVLISAARALPLTFDISILNTPDFGLPVGNPGNGNGANNADKKRQQRLPSRKRLLPFWLLSQNSLADACQWMRCSIPCQPVS